MPPLSSAASNRPPLAAGAFAIMLAAIGHICTLKSARALGVRKAYSNFAATFVAVYVLWVKNMFFTAVGLGQRARTSFSAGGAILRRRLEETVDSSPPYTQPRSKRARTSKAPPSDSDFDDHDTSNAIEQSIITAGQKFCITCAPWLHSGQLLLQTTLDDTYDPKERFENEENKSQGQLREVLELLRGKLDAQDLKQTWVAKAFLEGLNPQRSNTATRIRHQCASILGVDEAHLIRSETRREKFRTRIGWVVDAKGNGSYSSVDVEVLHKTYSGEYNLSSVFLNPVLLGVFIAIIRGPQAGKHFMVGITSTPRTETMAVIHNLHNITPGGIASAAVFARWALSADELFQPIGSITGINYLSDYEEYLAILEMGLLRKKKTVVNIIKEWDRQVFPNTDTSLVGGHVVQESVGYRKAMALLDADSDVEDMLANDN